MGKRSKETGWKDLRDGLASFLDAHGLSLTKDLVRKVGNLTLALAATEPPIPLKDKKMRDLSAKQRVFFYAKKYEGTDGGEFLGHWVKDGEVYFLFSQRTVTLARGVKIDPPGLLHKMISKLCHERPDPVVPYEKVNMAVPRFVRDMQGGMKYMSVSPSLQFGNAARPESGLWIPTPPLNNLLSILDHQDVHVHRNAKFAIFYTRWFGVYIRGV